MKVKMFHFIIISSLLYIVDAKAFQTSDGGTYKGEYDHMYSNMYLTQVPRGFQSRVSLSDRDQNFEMKYVPHVDGQPIFVPPIGANQFTTAVPAAFSRRKTRPPKQWPSRYHNLKNVQKVMVSDGNSVNPNIYEQYEIPEDHDIIARTKKKPNGHDNKQKPILNQISIEKPKKNVEYGNEVATEILSNKKKPVKNLVVDTKGDLPSEEVDYDYDKPVVIEHQVSNPVANEQYSDYDNPSIIKSINEASDKHEYYGDPAVPESFDYKEPVDYEANYEYDNPEVVDTIMKLNAVNKGNLNHEESREVGPLTKVPAGEIKSKPHVKYSNVYPDVEYSQIVEAKEENPKQDYDNPSVIAFTNKDTAKDQTEIKFIKKAVEDSYDNPTVIEELTKKKPIIEPVKVGAPSKTPGNYKNSGSVTVVKQPDSHKVDYNLVAINSLSNKKGGPDSDEFTNNKPSKGNTIKQKPIKHQSVKETIKDYDSAIANVDSVKPGIQKNSISSPALTKPASSWELEEHEIDALTKHKTVPDQVYNSAIIVNKRADKESVYDYQYDSPVVVEALTKQKTVPDQIYNSAIIVNKHADKESVYDYEYDSPVVVEALTKKKQVYPKQENLEWDSPVVVEALTKKHPTKKIKQGNKVIKDSNKNTANSEQMYEKDNKDANDNIHAVKDKTAENYERPDLFEYDYQNEEPNEVKSADHKGPAFLAESLSNEGPSMTNLVDVGAVKPENIVNKIDPFDDGSGLINERSGNFEEDSRGLFLKSDVWSLMSSFHSQERNKFKKCVTPTNEPGNCMPIQICPVPNLELTLEDLLKKVCTIDEIFVGICCPEFPAETLKVKWDNLTDTSSATVEEKFEMKETKECGKMKDSGKNLQSWPWMAPLISASTRRIFCGGVLIKERYVLTAAHCTTRITRNQILVILGPMTSKKDSTNQEFEVVEIKRHAQYNRRTMQNDIALLKLSRPVTLGELGRFICLPEEDSVFVGKEALMLGWQGSFAASKNEESLKVISPEECRNGVNMVGGQNMMCTEPRTEDTMCNLDSGAPLIIKEKGKFQVIGVLTWNRNDCDSRFPSIFTRVSHFRRWIDNHTS